VAQQIAKTITICKNLRRILKKAFVHEKTNKFKSLSRLTPSTDGRIAKYAQPIDLFGYFVFFRDEKGFRIIRITPSPPKSADIK